MEFMTVIVVSFLITFSLIPKVISFSNKKGFFDDPEGDILKIHKTPIPYLGGTGIFIGFVSTLLFVRIISETPERIFWVLIGGLLIISLGIWDDIKNVKPVIRLGGQLFVAGLTVYFVHKINTFPSCYIAIPLILIYILGSVNAINLFDGLDGLAGGVVSISLIGFSMIFYLQGDNTYLMVSLALLGSVSGFLPYNFNPARIFMGDNGSTLLGYILAVLAINVASKTYGSIFFIVPVILIGLPIIDTALSITRRFIKGTPIFVGDRSHIYDQLLDKGFSVKKAVLICYLMQTFLVTFGLFLYINFN